MSSEKHDICATPGWGLYFFKYQNQNYQQTYCVATGARATYMRGKNPWAWYAALWWMASIHLLPAPKFYTTFWPRHSGQWHRHDTLHTSLPPHPHTTHPPPLFSFLSLLHHHPFPVPAVLVLVLSFVAATFLASVALSFLPCLKNKIYISENELLALLSTNYWDYVPGYSVHQLFTRTMLLAILAITFCDPCF
jgi:hypothetical protein